MGYGDYDRYDQVNGSTGAASYGEADRTAVQSPRPRVAATGPAPAPVASPPQQVGAARATTYERVLDRGSRLSLKVAGVLLALLAVMFVASLVYTSVAGAVSKAGSSVAASTATSAGSSSSTTESVAGQTSSSTVSEVIDTVKGHVSSAQGVADAAERVGSELESLADKATSALTELSYSLSR